MDDDFSMDVQHGLSQEPKRLYSKYFYDEAGDRIFQQIMRMPGYYLTDSELEILDREKNRLLELFLNGEDPFHLVEFGAGDGMKTRILLGHFLEQDTEFVYNPIDISENVLKQLEGALGKELPALKVESLNLEYFSALDELSRHCCGRKVILFLGSNIGNLTDDEAGEFFNSLQQHLTSGDLVLTGFDLKKEPEVILKAYDDPAGITRSFNLNLLERINRELGGDFNLEQFDHYPLYDPVSGETRSYLISRSSQVVEIKNLPMTVYFDRWESIFMEISQKYDLKMINSLAERSGFEILINLFDAREYFVDSLWMLP